MTRSVKKWQAVFIPGMALAMLLNLFYWIQMMQTGNLQAYLTVTSQGRDALLIFVGILTFILWVSELPGKDESEDQK
jgi:hypothetical protein